MLLEVRAGFVLVPFEIAEANRSHVASLESGQLSVFLGIALLERRRSPKVTNKAEIVLDRHTAAVPAVLNSSARVRNEDERPTNVGLFALGWKRGGRTTRWVGANREPALPVWGAGAGDW